MVSKVYIDYIYYLSDYNLVHILILSINMLFVYSVGTIPVIIMKMKLL